MFAVALNYGLSLVVVLVVYGLAWGVSRFSASKARGLSDHASRSLLFLAAMAFLVVAGMGEVGMTHSWSSGSDAAKLDQGVFLVLVVVGTFLMVLEHFVRRPVR